jgi:hypothetical protein
MKHAACLIHLGVCSASAAVAADHMPHLWWGMIPIERALVRSSASKQAADLGCKSLCY